MAGSQRVKIHVRVDHTGYKKKYQVVKETSTPLPPLGSVILGTFTTRKLADQFCKAANETYNAPSEIDYRKMRG